MSEREDMMVNKFAGRCKVDGVQVPAGKGFCDKVNGVWVCYCAAHAPKAAPVSTKRTLNVLGQIHMAKDYDALPLLRAMPGARWTPEATCWTVSLKIEDRPRVLELAKKLGLEIAPELLVKTSDLVPEVAAAEKRAKVKALGPWQVEGASFLALRKRAILADDMGLGKTFQVLQALPEGARVIVVAPKSVKLTWRNEVRQWRPEFKTTVLKGKGSFRLPAAGEIVIVNYDLLPIEDTFDATGCVIIADEAHLLKNYKTSRAKRFTSLSKKAEKVWILTGTPLPNKPGDLFGVLSSGDMAHEVFGSWPNFVKIMGGEKARFGYEWGTPRADAPERLRRVMLRRLKSECLELPPKMYSTVEVDIESEALNRDLARLDDDFGDLVAAGQLPPFEAFSRVRAALAQERIPAMLDLVESYEDADKPVIVFSAHRAPIDMLAQREGWGVITGDSSDEARAEVVRAFQAGELKGVGLTIAAGGVGITLTRASTAIFVDLAWRPCDNSQAEDRINRIGQKAASIQIVRMVSSHPLEQHVMDLLAEKQRMIESAVEKEVEYDLNASLEREKKVRDVYEHALAQAEAVKVAQTRERSQACTERVLSREPSYREIVLTEAQDKAVREAYEFMMSRCDGAQEKDFVGFNKPHAAIAHHLSAFAFDNPATVRAMFSILKKYPRQLKDTFPALWA